MRAEIGGSNVPVLLRNQELPPSASIIFAAKMFVDALGDRLVNVVAAGITELALCGGEEK